jgi:hypothetical protein
MAIDFSDNFLTQANKPTDSRAMDYSSGSSVPYASISAATSEINAAYRYQFMTIWCTSPTGLITEYWWRSGTLDADLEPKTTESYTLNSNGSITMTAPYYIIGVSVQPPTLISNLQIGTTSGGNDLEPGSPVAAGANYTLTWGGRILTNTTIWFTGIVTGTLILIDKKF